jgi:hypothetical protein
MNMYPGIALLYDNRLLRTELECEQFEQALEGLAGDTEDAVIQQIFKVFDDDTEQKEVMFGLVHFLESYQMEMYLTQLLESLPELLETGRNWAIILIQRILGDDIYRKDFADIAAGMPLGIKRCLAFLLEEIKEDKPRLFERRANSILGKLK